MKVKDAYSNLDGFKVDDFERQIYVDSELAQKILFKPSICKQHIHRINLFVSADKRLYLVINRHIEMHGSYDWVDGWNLLLTDEDADEFLFKYRTLVELHLMEAPKTSQEREREDIDFDKVKREDVEKAILQVIKEHGSMRPSELKKRVSFMFGTNVERGVGSTIMRLTDAGVLRINNEMKLELVEKNKGGER
ncbi:MAG: hypothetical protein U9P90_03350 [Patescibacteria group bacterium]|nr:hypothetical protein [Patescibacteria group bacterium]